MGGMWASHLSDAPVVGLPRLGRREPWHNLAEHKRAAGLVSSIQLPYPENPPLQWSAEAV